MSRSRTASNFSQGRAAATGPPILAAIWSTTSPLERVSYSGSTTGCRTPYTG